MHMIIHRFYSRGVIENGISKSSGLQSNGRLLSCIITDPTIMRLVSSSRISDIQYRIKRSSLDSNVASSATTRTAPRRHHAPNTQGFPCKACLYSPAYARCGHPDPVPRNPEPLGAGSLSFEADIISQQNNTSTERAAIERPDPISSQFEEQMR